MPGFFRSPSCSRSRRHRRHAVPGVRCSPYRQPPRCRPDLRSCDLRHRIQGRRIGLPSSRHESGLGLCARPEEFPKGSHHAPIVPILVATEAASSDTALPIPHADGVYPPTRCNTEGLAHLVKEGLAYANGRPLDAIAWDESPYQPARQRSSRPAQALYAQHSVDAIARHDAGARNLRVTSERVEDLIRRRAPAGHKIIVFVTGVPGAGKTLVGLNVATKKRDDDQPTHAVFLSGNGPLVAVLREALTRDEVAPPSQKGR